MILVTLTPKIEKNQLILNSKEDKFTTRITNVLEEIKRLIPESGVTVRDPSTNETQVITKEELLQLKVKITSDNNFPTASGVASSSSGLSCLAFCLSKVYGCDISSTEISRLARLGSGSACRSLYGGIVKWERGYNDISELETQLEQVDKNSVAVQVATQHDWEELCCIICVADQKQKDVSSTDGMQRSMETSPYIKLRESEVVPKHMEMIEKAIQEKDWNTFCEVIMKDSNSLHSVCMDTYPPIFYMNDTTKSIITLLHALNSIFYEKVGAYTVDAGANCFLITKQAHLVFLLDCICEASGLKDDEVKFNFKDKVKSEHNQIDTAQLDEIIN